MIAGQPFFNAPLIAAWACGAVMAMSCNGALFPFAACQMLISAMAPKPGSLSWALSMR